MKHFLTILIILGAGLLTTSFASAATLSLSPASTTVQVGQTVVTTVRVNAAGTAINAAEATVSFPSDLLKLVSVSKSSTIFKFWTVEPSGSNSSARVIFSGGLPSPGYSGSAGTIVKVTWQALAVGTANISVTGGKVLANDGLGTNVMTGQSGASYAIQAATTTPTKPTTPTGPVAPTLSSPQFSSQQQWYAEKNATITWTRPTGIEGVSYQLTRESATVPDETFENNSGSTSVALTDDGVWYFHLRAKYATGWSSVARLKLQRDTTPPEPFEISVERDRGQADPSPTLTFSATDGSSGIIGYSAAVNGLPGVPVTSPYTMTVDQAGEYHVVITATDGAGNSRASDVTFSVEGYAVPKITYVSTPLILLQALTVRGTAQAGDQVNIFLDGELLGSTYAGAPNVAATDGTNVRLTWNFTSEKTFSPGEHRLTITATSADGQTSLASDPVSFFVRGTTIEFNGRPVATFAAVPILGIALILFFTLIAFVMSQLWVTTRRLERREKVVDQELQELRAAVEKGHVPDAALEQAITMIDDDLVGRRRTPKRAPRRRSKKT